MIYVIKEARSTAVCFKSKFLCLIVAAISLGRWQS